MKSEILRFLSEQSRTESQRVIDKIVSKSGRARFKFANSNQIHSVFLQPSISSNRIILVYDRLLGDLQEPATFNFTYGSEHYFFAAKIKKVGNAYVIEWPTTIFQLVRRRHTRYPVPQSWNQTGSMELSSRKNFSAKVRILEMSLSGIKVHKLPELPKYNKGDKIRLSFKIFRRGEIQVDAIIRHTRDHKDVGQVLGIEFIIENPLLLGKIQNVCQDLILANS